MLLYQILITHSIYIFIHVYFWTKWEADTLGFMDAIPYLENLPYEEQAAKADLTEKLCARTNY